MFFFLKKRKPSHNNYAFIQGGNNLTVLIFADLSYDGDHFLTSGMLFPLLDPFSGLWFLLFL